MGCACALAWAPRYGCPAWMGCTARLPARQSRHRLRDATEPDLRAPPRVGTSLPAFSTGRKRVDSAPPSPKLPASNSRRGRCSCTMLLFRLVSGPAPHEETHTRNQGGVGLLSTSGPQMPAPTWAARGPAARAAPLLQRGSSVAAELRQRGAAAAALTLRQAAVLLEMVEQGVPDGLLAEHLGVAQHHQAVPAGGTKAVAAVPSVPWWGAGHGPHRWWERGHSH